MDVQNEAAAVVASPRARPPRPSSKLGIILGLLQKEEGASLASLAAVTDWQPHTTRAALTGLRKRGYLIGAERIAGADGSKQTVYRIAAEPTP
jgi:hypothetical protein